MKKPLSTSIIALAAIALTLGGCSKSDSNENNPTNNSPSAPSITISNGYGVLAAVKSVSNTTVAGIEVPLEVNTAVAAFYTNPGSSSLVDAGTVSLNSKNLTKSSGNAYVYQNLTDPLNFSTVSWNVAGSGSVPAISYTDDRPFPAYSGISVLPGNVTRSAGLVISLGSAITNADSVYVVLTDYSSHTILKRLGGSAAECVFSASELSVLSAGQGMIQVCPWNYDKEDFSDKSFYFVLEAAYTKQGIAIN